MLTIDTETKLRNLCKEHGLIFVNVCGSIIAEIKEEVTDITISDEVIETYPPIYIIVCVTKDGNKVVEYEAVEQGDLSSDDEKGVGDMFEGENDSSS